MKNSSRLNIHLHELRFGHEAKPPINARRTGREEGIDALAASIDAHGLIQALTVREIAGTAFVADGNRRLAALRLLAREGKIAENELVKVDLDVSHDDAEEISAAANIMRAPLHEADQYETFRELADRGLDEGKIASRFGIEPARVRRMLALGRLAPVVLQAWREDVFGRDAAGCVRAFTMAQSQEAQEAAFEKLTKGDRLYPHLIRAEFGAGDREASRLLNFVGMKDYVAGGGSVVEDLFGEEHAISDTALVKTMADLKLRQTCDRLRATGWKWADLESDLPSNWSYTWERLPVKKTTAGEGDRSRSGCVVKLTYEGKLDIVYGVVRPEPKKASSMEGGEAKPAAISAALMDRLSVQATMAVRNALTESPEIGIIALLAGFISGGYYGLPLRVRHEGLGHHEHSEKEPFDTAFQRLLEMSDGQLESIAAGIAGAAVDIRRQSTGRAIFDKLTNVLVDAIDSERMTAALAEAFDAEDYFNSVPKPFILQAIADADSPENAKHAEKLKKGDLIAYAMRNVASTGWLPPQLRTRHYNGPGTFPAVTADAAE